MTIEKAIEENVDDLIDTFFDTSQDTSRIGIRLASPLTPEQSNQVQVRFNAMTEVRTTLIDEQKGQIYLLGEITTAKARETLNALGLAIEGEE